MFFSWLFCGYMFFHSVFFAFFWIWRNLPGFQVGKWRNSIRHSRLPRNAINLVVAGGNRPHPTYTAFSSKWSWRKWAGQTIGKFQSKKQQETMIKGFNSLPYLGKSRVNETSMRPYFWGGRVRGGVGWLAGHQRIFWDSPNWVSKIAGFPASPKTQKL